ncbi:MAG: four-carbon acid sugar kinase family protein [Terracidiphilus sp.]
MPTEARIPDFVPPSFADPYSGRIVLLADDLTGACDAGAAFLRTGRTVRIWFGAGVEFSTPESVQAFNTNSRALSTRRAAQAVSLACTALGGDPNSLFFKKVDSAARGPLAAELLAAHRTLATRAILFAPAFPAAGRTVRDGTLEVEDAAGQRSQVRLERLFPLTVRGRIFHVAHARELAPAIDAGKSLLVCDSANQADLDALARAAKDIPGLLYAGSAGLAQALASLAPARPMASLVPPTTRTLLIAGTSHPVTKLQLEQLDSADQDGVRVLRLRLAFGASARIRSAFRAYAPQALILTGGETAQLAVRALGAHSFILQGEFAPGIPWGTVQGGDAHGCTVVTKSGGFGSPTAFVEILAALRGRA